MYYIVETQYVGPNREQHIDGDTIEIRDVPARGNSAPHPIILNGWCGTTHDWAVYAHGEYETLEAAQEAVKGMGPVRATDPHGEPFNTYDEDDVVAIYKPGAYAPLSKEASSDWIRPGLEEIHADMTDEQVRALVAEWRAETESEGYQLDGDVYEWAIAHRQQLRDEAA